MGAPKMKTAGGGSAKPTADAFNQFLLEQIQNGGLTGMMSGQNNPSPLSLNSNVDMNNPQFAAMNQYLQNQQSQNMASVNERYGGANARGTPGAFAQGNFLAQSAPQNVLAMSGVADNIRGQNRADFQAQGQYDLGRMGMDQNNMQMLMQAMMQANQLGTPQAQNYMQPGAGSQFLGALSSLAPFALAPFTGGASLGIPGMMGAAGGMVAGKMMGGGGGAIGGNGQNSFGFGGLPGMPIMPPINPMWGK